MNILLVFICYFSIIMLLSLVEKNTIDGDLRNAVDTTQHIEINFIIWTTIIFKELPYSYPFVPTVCITALYY